MTDLTSSAREKLERVLSFLNQESTYAMDREGQAELRRRGAELMAGLERMERAHLTLGLLGGTGTGKSTLINALAGAEISSASHRRPNTENVVVYRHELSPSPGYFSGDVPLKEILHDCDFIRHILLCDLPDFDSLEEGHRAAVSAFLSKLDIIVWTVTPEKYADAQFYRFMDRASVSRDNFLFVLNKVDLLFEGVPQSEGYDRLSKVSTGLAGNLAESGMKSSIYNVSSLEALKGVSSPWNQFEAFRSLVFKHRDAKTVSAIKASNIEAETSGILDVLQKEAHLARKCIRTAADIATELRSGSSAPCFPPPSIVPPGIEHELRWRMIRESGGTPALVGPGQVIGLAAGWFGRPGPGKHSSSEPPVSGEAVESFRMCLSWAKDRFLRAAMREDIPSALSETIAEELQPAPRAEFLRSRLQELAAFAVEEMPRPGYRFFRLRQRFCYGSLLVVLLVVLGSEPAWLRLFMAPDFVALADLVLTFIHTLFSAQGLAALASYGLVNLFFGVRYFRRHRRMLDRRLAEMTGSLASRFKSEWSEALKAAADDLEGEAVRRLSAAAALDTRSPEKLQ